MRIGALLRYPDRKGNRWQRSPDPRAHRQSLARSIRQWRQVTVQAGEEGIRLLLVSRKPLREPIADRDEHAGPFATGEPRDSGRDLHRERLSRMRCCSCIAAVALPSPETRRKAEKKSLRESVNSILWPFAHEVLIIRHAIPGIWTRWDRKPEGMQSAALQRSRALAQLSVLSRC